MALRTDRDFREMTKAGGCAPGPRSMARPSPSPAVPCLESDRFEASQQAGIWSETAFLALWPQISRGLGQSPRVADFEAVGVVALRIVRSCRAAMALKGSL